MSTKIYCLTHKEFNPPSDQIYVPLSVFEDSGYNIADKNCYYSELTGCYWAWKNSDADIIGTCHYRRFLLNDEGTLYNEEQIKEVLKSYDLITTKRLTLNFSYEYGFSKNHKPYYLEEFQKLISEKYAEIYPIYKRLVAGVHTYFGNMMICKRELFDDYHNWLFTLLFDLESRIVIDEPDSYHRRIFGFISEFLLYVYMEWKDLKIKHSMVGMFGEKTEVRAIKKELEKILFSGDVEKAKEYFLKEHEKRPDIMMEASDIGRELRLYMQAISTAEYELDAGRKPFFMSLSGAQEMFSYLRALNKAAAGEDFDEHCRKNRISPEAAYVAKAILPS